MNAFEDIVAQYFEHQDYWIRKSVKLDIGKQAKRLLGKPSMPRPEIDVVGYHVGRNEILLVEVKSYLDSPGVKFDHVCRDLPDLEGRYKLLTNQAYRATVTDALLGQWRSNLVHEGVKVKYALVAGKVYGTDHQRIADYFDERNWLFVSPRMIADWIRDLANQRFEDSVAMMVAKLLMRNSSLGNGDVL